MPQSAPAFPVADEYARCVGALQRAGLLAPLPSSARIGVIGVDGRECALPTAEQVAGLLTHHRELVDLKVAQGFDRLAFAPRAMPAALLMERLEAAIIKHGADGTIYRTRRSPDDPLIPVCVHKEKQVWIWETLRKALETGDLVYVPQPYARDHRGLTKTGAIHDARTCAVAGWSVALVERLPVMPEQGTTIGGRKQLEIGASPNA